VTVDAPTYDTARHGTAALVDAVATHDAEAGETSIFVVNRSLDDEVELVVDVAHLGDVAVGGAHGIHDPDMHAANTLRDPERVGLVANGTARVMDGELRIVLPPVSWTAITLR
jgi:alpha-N-arabinofuranosidase